MKWCIRGVSANICLVPISIPNVTKNSWDKVHEGVRLSHEMRRFFVIIAEIINSVRQQLEFRNPALLWEFDLTHLLECAGLLQEFHVTRKQIVSEAIWPRYYLTWISCRVEPPPYNVTDMCNVFSSMSMLLCQHNGISCQYSRDIFDRSQNNLTITTDGRSYLAR